MAPDRVLLPPAAGRASGPLPGWVAAVALVGLSILLLSTVPAVLRRMRLARDFSLLQGQVATQEREVLRLEREVRAARADTFAYEQALRRLLHPAASEAVPAVPPRRGD